MSCFPTVRHKDGHREKDNMHNDGIKRDASMIGWSGCGWINRTISIYLSYYQICWLCVAMHCKIVLSGHLSLNVTWSGVAWWVGMWWISFVIIGYSGWMFLVCMVIQRLLWWNVPLYASGLWKCWTGLGRSAGSFHAAIDWSQFTKSNISFCIFKVTFKWTWLRCVLMHFIQYI